MSLFQKKLPIPYEYQALVTELSELLQQLRYLLKTPRRPTRTLVIGPSQSGKSSLIKTLAIEHKVSSQHFSLWVNPHELFIEISGQLIKQHPAHSWAYLGRTLQRFRSQPALNNIIITLNIHDLIRQSLSVRQQMLRHIADRLGYLTQHTTQPIPTQLVFTHCDQINGFQDFFADCPDDLRHQPWGIASEQDFHDLLFKLDAQVLDRLQQTQSAAKRKLIKEFPLQMESVRQLCLSMIHQFTKRHQAGHGYLIKGAFFVSSKQHGPTLDLIANSISKEYALASTHPKALAKPSKPFFAHDLLSKTRPKPAYSSWLNASKYLLPSIPLLLLIGGVFWLKNNFNHTVTTLQTVQHNLHEQQLLAQFQLNEQLNLDQLVAVLNQLQTLADDADYAWLSPSRDASLSAFNNGLTQVMQQILQQKFMPELGQQLAHALEQTEQPDIRYRLLTSYLMLAEPQRLQPDYLSRQLQTVWHVPAVQLENRLYWLDQALQNYQHTIPIDRHVIHQARADLHQLPAADLLYLRLTGDDKWDPHTAFTRNGAVDILQTRIPNLVQTQQRRDWILGGIPEQTDTAALTLTLTTRYLTEYRNWWQKQMIHQQPLALNHPNDVLELLISVHQDSHSLLEAAEQARIHTAAMPEDSPLSQQFNQYVALYFSDTIAIHPDSIPKLQPFLQSLGDMFVDMDQSTALRIAQQRFNQTLADDPFTALLIAAEFEPEPIKQWLTTLSHTSWALVVTLAQRQLNQQWLTRIYPGYYAHIANRFPLVAGSPEDIELTHFHDFFGPEGQLSRFIHRELMPFLDPQTADWQPKEVDGVALAISTQSRQMLQLADIIQTMFFDEASGELNVAFAIQPIEINPFAQHVMLNLHGQTSTAQAGSSEISNFSWHAQQQPGAQFLIQDLEGQQHQLNESGPWAWLRLLQQMEIIPSDNPQLYTLTLMLDHIPAARYYLSSATVINPFIPNVIDYFDLPEQVVG